jgi:hypothetical protein
MCLVLVETTDAQRRRKRVLLQVVKAMTSHFKHINANGVRDLLAYFGKKDAKSDVEEVTLTAFNAEISHKTCVAPSMVGSFKAEQLANFKVYAIKCIEQMYENYTQKQEEITQHGLEVKKKVKSEKKKQKLE